jgi:hypothetical protein
MKCRLSWLLAIVTALSATGAAAQNCAKNPEAKWGCFWTKGIVNESADAGDVLSLEDHGLYNLDIVPDSLDVLLRGKVGDDLLTMQYVVGDFEFCPFAPRLHGPAGVHNLEWRFFGCIESFKDVTVVDARKGPKAAAERVCTLVDCSRPGFLPWRSPENQR